MAGVAADGRQIVNRSRDEASNYKRWSRIIILRIWRLWCTAFRYLVSVFVWTGSIQGVWAQLYTDCCTNCCSFQLSETFMAVEGSSSAVWFAAHMESQYQVMYWMRGLQATCISSVCTGTLGELNKLRHIGQVIIGTMVQLWWCCYYSH